MVTSQALGHLHSDTLEVTGGGMFDAVYFKHHEACVYLFVQSFDIYHDMFREAIARTNDSKSHNKGDTEPA
jgi:hypothetical protein